MSHCLSYTKLIAGPDEEPLDVAEVRDDHLKAADGNAEDAYIGRLIRVARSYAERLTRRAIPPQTLAWVGDAIPTTLVVPRPPCIEVLSFTYVDEDGQVQSLTEGVDFVVSRPTGPTAGRALIRPAYDASWPTTRVQPDAVTVTYRAGYVDDSVSPAEMAVPEDITHGMLLVIGELYKQRSESVHAFAQNPALVSARNLWMPYRVY